MDGEDSSVTHRFAATKHHKLRGQYERVFGIGPGGFVNVDPLTGNVTNRWTYSQLCDILLPNPSESSNHHDASSVAIQSRDSKELKEFKLIIKDGSGPFGSSRSTLSFSSVCRGELLSTLRANMLVDSKRIVAVKKIQRRERTTRECLVIAGESGLVEVDRDGVGEGEGRPPKVKRAYRYVDILNVTLIKDKGIEGVAIAVGREKRPHAFVGGEMKQVLQMMLTNAKASGIELRVNREETLDLAMWNSLCEQYERQAEIGHVLTQCTVRKRQQQAKQVLLQVTSSHIVELDPSSSVVLSVRSLNRLHAVVLHQESQHTESFHLVFHSDERIVHYSGVADVADTLVSHIIDATRQRNLTIEVLGRSPRSAVRVCPLRLYAPQEMQLLFLRRMLGTMSQQVSNNTKARGGLDALNFSNKQALKKVVLSCAELNENSPCPMHPFVLNQFSNNSELYGAGTVGLFSATCALLSRREPTLQSALLTLLDSIRRIVDRTWSTGHFDASQTPELVSLVSLCLQPSSAPLLKWKGYQILLSLLGGCMGQPKRDRNIEMANKRLLFAGSFGRDMIQFLVSQLTAASSSPLFVVGAATSVLERLLVSGRDSTPEEVHSALLRELEHDVTVLIPLIHSGVPGILYDVCMLVKVIVEDAGRQFTHALQLEALRSGAVLTQLFESMFSDSLERRTAHRFLLSLWTKENPLCHQLLKRVFPPGLYHALSHPDVSFTQKAVLQQASHDDKNNNAAKALPRKARTSSLSAQDWSPPTVTERIELIQRLYTAKIGPGTNADSFLSHPEIGSTPQSASSGELTLPHNFTVFFHMAEQDHYLPDLIWNPTTRQELKRHIENERDVFFGQGENTQQSRAWNYEEFNVNYPSLAGELCIGGCYLSVLVREESGVNDEPRSVSSPTSHYLERVVEQIRDPGQFWQAVYRSFLKELARNNIALVSTCLRVMKEVYRRHVRSIGTVEDVDSLLVSLNEIHSLSLRADLLQLIETLTMDAGNTELLILKAEEVMPFLFAAVQCSLVHVAEQDVKTDDDAPRTWHVRVVSDLQATENSSIVSSMHEKKFSFAALCRKLRLLRSHEELDRIEVQGAAADSDEWTPVKQVDQLAWKLLHVEESVDRSVAERQCAKSALAVLRAMLALHPSADEKGRRVCPAPKVKRVLSSLEYLGKLVRTILHGDDLVVREAARILLDIVESVPQAVKQLYRTGLFFVALRFQGSQETAELLADLVAATHLSQDLPDRSNETTLSAESVSLAQLSAFHDILPECMITLLERHGPERFAKVLGGDFNTPEFIWTQEMRKDLVSLLDEHLGDFIPRSKEDVALLFDWIPLPPVLYPSLEGEYWCGGYYLHNLVCEEKFAEWPIAQPKELLQSCLDAWKHEVQDSQDLSDEDNHTDEATRKQTGTISVADARELLSLEKGASRSDLRVAYRAAARRRLEAGSEPRFFQELNEAFHALSKTIDATDKGQADRLEQQGPVDLLLKTQCLLFKRYASHLRGLQYPAFPLLVEFLKTSSRRPLLLNATELLYQICLAAPSHTDELIKAGGLEVLVQLLSTYLGHVLELASATSWVDCVEADIVENVLHSLVGLASLVGPQKDILDLLSRTSPCLLLEDFKKILARSSDDKCQKAAQYVLQILARLASEERGQNLLIQGGMVWSLIPVLFLFSAPQKPQPTNMQDEHHVAGDEEDEDKTRRQALRNVTAKHAARSLSRIAGVLQSKDLASPRNDLAVRTLEGLFTRPIADLFAQTNPTKLLSTLNGHVETPLIIWNESLANEVLSFVADSPQFDYFNQGDHGAFFQLEGLKGEPVVGGVFLRVFNSTPCPLPHPEQFAVELLREIQALGDGEIQEDGEEKRAALLEGFFNVLTTCQDLSEVANALVLAEPPILGVLVDLVTNAPELRWSALKSIGLAVSHPVFAKSIAHSGLLGFLFDTDEGQDALAQQTFVLELVENLMWFPRSVEFLYEEDKKRYLNLVKIVIDAGSMSPQVRSRAASVLATSCKEKVSGSLARQALGQLLPRGMVVRLLEGRIVQVLDTKETKTAELIWNESMLQTLSAAIASGSCDVTYDQLSEELCVEGVFVGLFLQDPKVQLTAPKRFAHGLLKAFNEELGKRMGILGPGDVVSSAFASEGGDPLLIIEEEQDTVSLGANVVAPPPVPDRRQKPPPPVPARPTPPPPVPSRAEKPSLRNLTQEDSVGKLERVKKEDSVGKLETAKKEEKKDEAKTHTNGSRRFLEEEFCVTFGQDKLWQLSSAIVELFEAQPRLLGETADGGYWSSIVHGLKAFVEKREEVVFVCCLRVLNVVVKDELWAKRLTKESSVETLLSMAVSPLSQRSPAMLLVLSNLLETCNDMAEKLSEEFTGTLLRIVVHPEDYDDVESTLLERVSPLAQTILTIAASTSRPVQRLLENSEPWQSLFAISNQQTATTN